MIETISGTVKQVRQYISTKNLGDDAKSGILEPLAELAEDSYVMMDVESNAKVECLHTGATQTECSEAHAIHRADKLKPNIPKQS